MWHNISERSDPIVPCALYKHDIYACLLVRSSSLFPLCVLLSMRHFLIDFHSLCQCFQLPMIKMSHDISERGGPIVHCALYKHNVCTCLLVQQYHLFLLCVLF